MPMAFFEFVALLKIREADGVFEPSASPFIVKSQIFGLANYLLFCLGATT